MKITNLTLHGFKRLALNNIEHIEVRPENKIQLILGSNGSGKAQPLYSKIKTPYGWQSMGEMQVGSEVIAYDGSVTHVTAVYPQPKQTIYEIEFGDGRKTHTSACHLWRVYKDKTDNAWIMKTSQIKELLSDVSKRRGLWIDLIKPQDSEDIELPLDPYILGGILMSASTKDGQKITWHPNKSMDNKIAGLINDSDRYSLQSGLKSHCIPRIYLKASARQRLELLKGYIYPFEQSVDGYEQTGYICYAGSQDLGQDIVYLIRSLGGTALMRERDVWEDRINLPWKYQIFFDLDMQSIQRDDLGVLDRDNSKSRLRITHVTAVGEDVCQCISIDHPERLYVTDDFIVTHNSSLMKEVTPLPANHQEFHKDGYKHIEILHNNSRYVLKSHFYSSGNKFHFIKDDEEMNPGGTMTVYKELVKKEFNITPDIHELLIGTMRFHSMSTSERRVWITRLSQADYTYAVQYYKRLSEQHRDMVGAIKLSQTRLLQESDKLLKPEQEQICRQEIEMFSHMLSHLLELKSPVFENAQQVNHQLSVYETELKSLSEELLKNRSRFLNNECFTDIQAIDDGINEAKGRSQALTVLIDQLSQKIQSQQNTLQALKDSNVESSSDLKDSISDIQKQMELLKEQIVLKFEIPEPVGALYALDSIYENLHSFASQIEENKDKRYSRDRYQQALDKQKDKQGKLTQLQSMLQDQINRKKELEHFRDHNKLQCPQCDHTWHQGYEVKDYEQTLAIIERLGLVISDTDKELQLVSQYLDQAKTYLEHYRSYVLISKAWTSLEPLWTYLSDSGIIFERPKHILNVIETLKMDLSVMIKIKECSKRLNESLELKDLLSKNQELSVSSLNLEVEQLNHELYLLNQQQKEQNELITRFTGYKTAAIQINYIQTKLEFILDARKEKIDRLMDLNKRQAITEVIEVVRLELQQREQLISRIDIQKALVANIESQIIELTEKAEVLKLAMIELSPSQGLIAKGLTGFINHLVRQINQFIKKIWLYPLELIPIQITDADGVDLDYKFEFRVNSETTISDISKGSTGMKEVIDLAFKIVAMQYLDLQNSPIYLDELAASFDKSHREAAYRLVHDLVNNSNYSQIYIISHFADSYGSFTNSDVIALHEANIAKSKDAVFNRNVLIS